MTAGVGRSARKVTVRMVVRAVPPVGVKVVATRTRSGPFVRAVRAAALRVQVRVNVPAPVAVRAVVHAVRVADSRAVGDVA